VAEAECGDVFVNTKAGNVTRTTLTEMVHPQEAIDLKKDNSTEDEIINKTVQQKCSKAMDMRFYWIQDRVEQVQFVTSPSITHQHITTASTNTTCAAPPTQ
jgi:hypothetical protein